MRYGVIFSSALSVFLHSGFLLRPRRAEIMVVGTLGLGAFIVIHSYFFSPMKDVSILKAASWSVVMATIMAAWSRLVPAERERLARHLFAGLLVLMMVSLPLLLIPSIGYFRNGSGFQGILNHPQVFGPTMALLGAWAGSRMFSENR